MRPIMLAQTSQPTSQEETAIEQLVEKSEWLRHNIFGMNVSVGRVLIAFAILLAALVAGRIVRSIFDAYGRRLAKGEERTLLGLFLHCLGGPVYVAVFGLGLGLALTVLLRRIPALVAYGSQIGTAVVYIGMGWFIYNLVDIVEFYLNRLVGRTETKLDDQLVPLLRKTMRVMIVILAALFIAQNVFRANIGAMLAGLGVGGLAVALAAQDTIANFFGSITIFADRPFAVGDVVKLESYTGTVEEVGFRSSKLRTFDGHLVTLPNKTVANANVENISRRPSIRRVADITLTYDTPPEKVERAVRIVGEVLAGTEHVEQGWWVAFNAFNDWSLNLNVKYTVSPPDYVLSLKTAEQVNLKIMRAFAEAGIEFAFPTQTLYHKTEAPLKIEQSTGEPRP